MQCAMYAYFQVYCSYCSVILYRCHAVVFLTPLSLLCSCFLNPLGSQEGLPTKMALYTLQYIRRIQALYGYISPRSKVTHSTR